MGMFGPGKEGWLAEAEMLSWAFRHLKAEERDYLTKRLKHVLGKRTLKGSWFEKDKSLVEMLVAGPAHRAGLGSLPLMTAANTEKMHALDYPGLPEDKTPEAFFRRVEAAATHEKSKEAMRPFMRRSTALLMTAGPLPCSSSTSADSDCRGTQRPSLNATAGSLARTRRPLSPSALIRACTRGRTAILKAKRRPQARSPKALAGAGPG